MNTIQSGEAGAEHIEEKEKIVAMFAGSLDGAGEHDGEVDVISAGFYGN